MAQQLSPARVGQIVTFNNRNSSMRHALFLRHLPNAPGGGERVGGPEIAHDGNAVFQTSAKHGPRHRLQQRRITAVGIFAAVELRQRQRMFRERLEDQRSRAAARDQRLYNRRRRFRPVAAESRGAANGKCLVTHLGPLTQNVALVGLTNQALGVFRQQKMPAQ